MQPVGDGDFASKREGRSLVIRQIQAAQQELFLAVGARQGLKMMVGAQKEPSHRCVQRPCSGGTVPFTSVSRFLLHTLLYVPNV
ncbi:unnamed protein product [Rangifer tarandus platyrhynchus]|uniref:Uncharacterized protein n=3 Tax=Rangifer tarandus platyrhynchus TaxID=3082113 RepID=A0ACB0FC71_RANTA|nr:unnamed protein product [Rangifer tarandus platyrhynchus]CAI9710680.1 unnamed protein product [Rangifer tarandus platyrhynchus]